MSPAFRGAGGKALTSAAATHYSYGEQASVETGGGLAYRDRRRAWIDRLTRRIVVGSGWLVLLSLLLIFGYLLYVVTPLFLSPSIQALKPVAVASSAPAVAQGIDDAGRLAFRIDQAGNGEFIALDSGETLSRASLSPPVDRVAQSAGEQPLFALSHADGSLTLAGPVAAAWRYPLGPAPLKPGWPAQPLRQLAVTEHDDRVQVAAVTADNRLWAQTLTPPGGQAQAALSAPVEKLLLAQDGRLIYTLSGNQLSVWQWDAQGLAQRETVALNAAPPLTLTPLAGGRSLLVQAADGRLTQWFDTPGEQGMRLTDIRDFPATADAHALLLAEPLRRVFATLTPQGEFALFASKQPGALLTAQVAPQARQAVFSPHGRALLVETAQGWQPYRLDNAYPGIGWRGMWQKLWYENYPQPGYVWQPTAADDGYEAKFSLMPLLAGTLKAALYAMLFATPLALAAAVYTACFMSPALRRWVKPALEIMGSLPTVVIGLIAALWLAPHFATYLGAILLLPLLWTLAALGSGWLLEQLPPRLRRRFPAGWDALLLLPSMLLTLLAACWLGPRLELLWLGEPLYQRLGEQFSQRNALVAGVALGLALIPLIFSLAEDALFSVPASLSQGSQALGATAWQTLWRVVLPSASAGIFAALMLGFGRAVGETMIVLMATGNTPVMDASLFSGLRSLAANIAIEMPEAAMSSGHYRVLFLSALVLFGFTLVVNTLAEAIRQRLRRRYRDEGGNA